jgi:hypothetical protein
MVTFICIKNGPFTSGPTYLGGMAPTPSICGPMSPCELYVPPGYTLTTTDLNGVLNMNFAIINVASGGTLQCGSGNSPFTFNYPVNIIVNSQGVIQFLTSNPTLLLPPSSIITLYAGGSFSTTGVVVQTYTSAGPGSSVTFNTPMGPLTCGILPSGTVVMFNMVTFICIKNGPFTSGPTYLGGMAPTPSICGPMSPCELYVPQGYTLTTTALNGVLNMNFAIIYVAPGGTLQLGMPGSNAGFGFTYAVQLNVYGTLSFACSGGGINIPPNSEVNFYSGGSFTSIVVTFIQVYNPSTNVNIGQPMPLQISFSGPYFITITITGTIYTSTTGMNEISDFHFVLN